jgi:hypothetical protein
MHRTINQSPSSIQIPEIIPTPSRGRGVILRHFQDHTTAGRTTNFTSPNTCSRGGARHKGVSQFLQFPSIVASTDWASCTTPPHPYPTPRDFELLISGTLRDLTTQVSARSHPSQRYFRHVFCSASINFAEIMLPQMTVAPAAMFWPTFQQLFRQDNKRLQNTVSKKYENTSSTPQNTSISI